MWICGGGGLEWKQVFGFTEQTSTWKNVVFHWKLHLQILLVNSAGLKMTHSGNDTALTNEQCLPAKIDKQMRLENRKYCTTQQLEYNCQVIVHANQIEFHHFLYWPCCWINSSF